MTKAWMHVLAVDASIEAIEGRLARAYPDAVLRQSLDGTRLTSIEDFYNAVEEAVPLIKGFGHNLNALIDLFRTFGWGNHAGKAHTFLWFRPEVLLRSAPREFHQILDIITGTTKELLVGEETDPEFDPDNAEDWVPTRVDVVLACRDTEAADQIASLATRLTDDWADEFHSLDVSVNRNWDGG